MGETKMDASQVFLRGAWTVVPSEEDIGWVDRAAAQPLANEPLGDYGSILREMISKGVSKYSIARFAKIVGYETAFGLLYHLEDSNASYEGFDVDAKDLSWGLYLQDDSYQPTEQLSGLHETILSLDPSGREMRPRAA